MSVEAGSTLLHYRLTGKLGAGGMGEVWRATDTTLERDVAIKILPPTLATDAERLARFEREAKVLASLNHPNVATVHGYHDAGGVRFLVMELVPGETLEERLRRGPMPVDEAVSVARRIAEGIEYAHERGIVHRDLKPANVKLTGDGGVKVLDFGLAKAISGDSTASTGPTSTPTVIPTLTSVGTVAGMILGTAAYMSPEQARGTGVDRRADIWAFGAVLWEMVTGKRLFEEETASDTLAAVLRAPIEWSQLPASLPPSLVRLLKRCLERDPKKRLRDIGEARIALDGPLDEPVDPAATGTHAPPPRSNLKTVIWAATAIFISLLGVAIIGILKGPAIAEAPSRSVHIEYPFVADSGVNLAPPVISPDGRMLVYGRRSPTNELQLWLRRFDAFEAQALPETEDAVFPFWSPDSRSIAYFASGSLRRIEVESEATQIISEESDWGRGGSWHANGKILFVPHPNSPVMLVAATGGKPVAVTELDTKLADVSHRFPQWLPDGEHFLYTVWSNNADVLKDHGGVYVASVKPGFERRKLLGDPTPAVFCPPDRILIYRRGRLLSLPFDVEGMKVSEEAVAIDSDVTFALSSGALAASASANGDLAYAVGIGEPDTELLWMDRAGQTTLALNQSGQFYGGVAVAPDGIRFATGRATGMAGQQIWIGDANRATIMPLTHSSNDSFSPVWSPDGTKVAFSSRETGNEDIYLQDASGTKPWEMIHDAKDHDTNVSSWSPDGQHIFFEAHPRGSTARSEIWMLDVATKNARAILSDSFQQSGAVLSPDGRWLAYTSSESGEPQIVIRNFPALDRKWLVAAKHATDAHWSADGRELIAVGRDDEGARLLAIPLSPDATAPNPGTPRELVRIDPRIGDLAPNPTHSRFLVMRDVKTTGRNAIRVVLK